MSRSLRIAALSALALLASPTWATPARGDGLPLPLDASQTGVASQDGAFDETFRYQTIPAGEGTSLVRIDADGVVVRWRYFDRNLSIPAVAYDGTSSGLSADGRTLALIEPRNAFPRTDTPMVVVDAQSLRPREEIVLRGDFSFDAISPDGQTIYLIEYLDRRDPTQYEVRSYDLEAGRLDPQPIVDPEESSEEMYGSPMTRATSPDGRWAYTLYDGAHHPFIHALDTERGAAVCIDLDPGAVPPRRLPRMTLDPSPDGSTLTVTDPTEGPVAIVDTKSFDVTQPEASPPADSGSEDSGGTPWLVIVLGALGVGALSAVVIRRRRRSSRVDSDELEQLVRVDQRPEVKPEADANGADVKKEKRDWHRVS
jgi:hypothetical protein